MKMKVNSVPAFDFQPFSVKQKKLLTWWTGKSPYCEYDMIICDGSIRSGKTVSMITSFMQWSLFTFKDKEFIIAGKSMGALKRNVLKPMFQILSALNIEYHYHRSENYVTVGTNTYYCFGANNESSQDTLQGLTAAGAYADEAALIPESFISQMIGRCSIDYSKVWMNCNPEGPYHPLKVEYIDKAKEKKILHLHFMLDDNPSLSERIKDRYKRMFTGVFYKRYILGLWAIAEGIIYDMWTDENTFTDADLPQGYKYLWRRYIGIDVGTQNATCFLDCWDDGETIWIVKEYYHSGRTEGQQKENSEYADELEKFCGKEFPPLNVIIDPSAASFKVTLKNRGFRTRDADNDVIEGIKFTATMIAQKKIKAHRTLCPNLLKEVTSYMWDEKATLRGEEKPVKSADHAMDAMRYVVKTMVKVKRLYGKYAA